MRLICSGEKRAFAELYRRYSGQMLRYFRRMLWKDEERAQDFVQDLFLKIVERPEAFREEAKFSTWLYSSAHNMCKNEYRREEVRTRHAGNLKIKEAFEERPDDRIDEEAFSNLVDCYLASCSEADRTLFVLRYELEKSFPEIAAILNVPEGTLKSRWFYLRKELAEKLRPYEMMIRI